MEKEEKAILWLKMFDFIDNNKALLLINEFGSAINVMQNVDKLEKYFSPDKFNKLKYSCNFDYINNYISNCEKQNIKIVTYASDCYPNRLKNISEPPMILYAKGNLDLLKNENTIAIVGSRRITNYGAEVTTKFATALTKAGLVIISGLAEGVDSIAHNCCLNANGKTIAVLGSGFNEIYPQINEPLAKKILENDGLIITEYKPNEKGLSFHFPKRNRIIAGLSRGVLITEATLKSGSMYTKDYALEFGKDLFVVPGRITDIYSFGCNSIIKSLQGSMVLSPEDILNVYNLKYDNVIQKSIQISIDEQLILNILKTDELHYDEILEKSQLDVKVLNTLLVKLEMKKIIKKLPGNYYCKQGV